jgi:zinc protease
MASSIGATGTNAWTSHEQTVYVNDIPSNEIKKWITLESTRFSELTLRLFHTELETVYEEFNMGQDRDQTREFHALFEALFPIHPYGTQTTIGKPEHLKNPSMVNIHNYFNIYYVPNNMAICLAGDLEYDKTIQMIDSSFGKLKPNPDLPVFKSPVEKPIDSVIVKNIYGPEPENLLLAFRLNGVKSKDRIYATILDRMLGNGTAGLIDIDITQKQKAIDAWCMADFMKYYGYHVFHARPKENQKLEEVKDILLAEVHKICAGEFDDWLITAAVNDIELDKLKQRDDYRWLSYDLVDAFTNGIEWNDYLKFFSDLEKINKKELVEFAKNNYKDNNYVVVYKRSGKDTNIIKVKKPDITKIELNRDKHSGFFKTFTEMPSNKLSPVYVDYQKDIYTSEIAKGIRFYSVKNPHSNDLFEINIIVDLDATSNRLLPVAMGYFAYLGTEKYNPEKLQQEFFKLGLRFDQRVGGRTSITVSGLNKSLEQSISLMEEVIQHAKADTAVYREYVNDIIKKRTDAKKSKEVILNAALTNYGMWGPKNAFNDLIPADSLRKINPQILTDLIKNIFTDYQHYFFYYGISESDKVISLIKKYHKSNPDLKKASIEMVYTENTFDKNRVYFVDYDMVQNNFVMISKDQHFEASLLPYAQLFSEYFGSGLSSVVFQEIRESRALAYSAYASYVVPGHTWDSYKIQAYVATQTDKLKTATDAMTDILNNMPKAEIQFNASKESILKRIETERITKTSIFWSYMRNKELGIDHDYRKDVYSKISMMTMDEMADFFNHHIKDKKYSYLVIGKRKDADMKTLKKLGEYKELTLEELFRY